MSIVSLNKKALHKTLVLGLDGYPHSLLTQRMQERPDSIWHQLLEEGRLYRTTSVRPEVSSVAWASYLTGCEPGEHGLLGFVDRTFSPPGLYFPNGAHLRRQTLPEAVHEAGGATISINIPATFPPKPVRGLIVGGFLGVTLKTNVHPPEWLPRLQQHNYTIDTDPGLAYQDLSAFYNSLEEALEARLEVAREAASEFNWDLLQLHLMETDRLFHFFWEREEWRDRFHAFLDRIDAAVAEFAALAKRENASLVILSDHGFTRARRVFFINAWLRREGLLAFRGEPPYGFPSIDHRRTQAYALVPGRVFINLKGRELQGIVTPGQDYERLRERLIAQLGGLRDPRDNAPVFSEVKRREKVYRGEALQQAADVLAFPARGIDLKADFGATELFQTPSTLTGAHTFDDALCYIRGEQPGRRADEADVAAVGRHVRRLLGLPVR